MLLIEISKPNQNMFIWTLTYKIINCSLQPNSSGMFFYLKKKKEKRKKLRLLTTAMLSSINLSRAATAGIVLTHVCPTQPPPYYNLSLSPSLLLTKRTLLSSSFNNSRPSPLFSTQLAMSVSRSRPCIFFCS